MEKKCYHTIDLLEGRADGIYCRGCGRTFAKFSEVIEDRPAAEAEPKKKEGKKNARK